MDEGRILQVRLSPEAHDALKKAAQGVRLESRSALIRAFADAVGRKSAKDLRMFLFFDEDELPPKQTSNK
jgi:hypothetical protein